jgi:leucyl-tRNA synthetase
LIPIFTTRPDTLWGVTFMALAPDAPIAGELLRGTDREAEGKEFIRRVLLKSEIDRVASGMEKEGFFTGRYAVNPVNGDKIPIYIADFVLASYGTGMIMAVPGHDQRDFEFARKYDIPIKVVIQPLEPLNRGCEACTPEGRTLEPSSMTEAYVGDGTMTSSGPFNGTVAGKGEAGIKGIERVAGFLEEKKLGRHTVQYRLKDWLVSRQRYWGTPIPMIHCDKCGIVTVPEKDLPVVLPPDVEDFKPRGSSVLASVPAFYETICPECGGPAHRDPDTMDTFVNSSWYMVRYTDPNNDAAPFGKDKADAWLPIDEYIGGIEHATGHLIFFRFFTKVMADMGLLSFREPATVLHTQGMVAHNGVTMSSSKNVGVWVGPFTAEHGADAGRLAVLFAAPPDKGMDWTDDLVTGVTRFLNRLWRIFEEHGDKVGFDQPGTDRLEDAERDLYIRLNRTIQKVITDTEAFQYNTAIAAQMEFLNDLYGFKDTESPVFGFALGRLIYLLAPFAPHIAEEFWHRTMPDADSLFEQRFPAADEKFTAFDVMTIPVQVNGKLRARLDVPRTASEEEITKLALADPGVAEHIGKKEVKKIIYVKNRLVSVVTGKDRK